MRLFLLILLCTPALGAAWAATPETGEARPNILLIVADDLGYADLGVHGSDIETPNIDALAARGLLFTQFHTGPLCAPTRAMLLSGNNNHVAGMARQSHRNLAGQPYPGYQASLSDRIVPFPRLLREAGYRTAMAGKWHLGFEIERGPVTGGFERWFANLHGAGNHWDAKGYKPGGSTYDEDGREVPWPEGAYSTELFTDRLIGYIDEAVAAGEPFFAFAAYTSPHWPLQVPGDELERYAGRYREGYDRLREVNFENLKKAGIVAPDSALPPRNDAITPWTELDAEEQRREARKMQLYAAMVSNLDHHVGRLLGHLEAKGVLENTLVLFMGDNGAAAEDFYNRGPFTEYLQANYDNAYENMGRPDSFVSYGPQWAEAGSAPFSRRKGYMREGGLVAPFIVAGPGVAARGEKTDEYLHVMDLAPTLLELAGAAYPEREGIEPMEGESAAAYLAGRAENVHGDEYVTVQSHGGRAYVRRGNWKLVNMDGPFDEDDFELFDVVADPGETTDLAAAQPEIYEELLELWRSERRRLGIVIPTDL